MVFFGPFPRAAKAFLRPFSDFPYAFIIGLILLDGHYSARPEHYIYLVNVIYLEEERKKAIISPGHDAAADSHHVFAGSPDPGIL